MQLYKPVQHRLSAYCRVVTGNEGKALDLIQETLASAFEGFERLRNQDSFLFFLFSIARNCHLKQQRKLKFFGKSSEIKCASGIIAPDSTEKNYDTELIHQSIHRLNTEQREAILLFQNVPLGEKITIVALKTTGDKIYLAVEEKVITENGEIKPDFQPITPDLLKTEMGKLHFNE